MDKAKRRVFLQRTVLGLAGVGATGFVLHSDAQPTLATVSGEEANRVLIQMGAIPKEGASPKGELKRVTPVSLGPWYKPGAPFRAKLSVPGEPGTTFVLSGRAWGFNTRRPLAGVVLDFWHVDTQEKYSNGVTDFRNRGRLVTSEAGYYELESIRPIPYRPNPSGSPDFWRCGIFIYWQFVPVISRSSLRFTSKKTQRCPTPCIDLRTPLLRKSTLLTALALRLGCLTLCWSAN